MAKIRAKQKKELQELKRREEVLEHFRKIMGEYVATEYSLFTESDKEKYDNDFRKCFYGYGHDPHGFFKIIYYKNYRFLYSFNDFKAIFYDDFLNIIDMEVKKYVKD